MVSTVLIKWTDVTVPGIDFASSLYRRTTSCVVFGFEGEVFDPG